LFSSSSSSSLLAPSFFISVIIRRRHRIISFIAGIFLLCYVSFCTSEWTTHTERIHCFAASRIKYTDNKNCNINSVSLFAETLSGNPFPRPGYIAQQAYDWPGLRWEQRREPLLPLPFYRRFRGVRMGLDRPPETLFEILLLRRMSLPKPTLPAYEPRPEVGSLLLAQQGLWPPASILLHKDDHHSQHCAWHGCRPVRMFVGLWRRQEWIPRTASPLASGHSSWTVPTAWMTLTYNMPVCRPIVRRLSLKWGRPIRFNLCSCTHACRAHATGNFRPKLYRYNTIQCDKGGDLAMGLGDQQIRRPIQNILFFQPNFRPEFPAEISESWWLF